MNLKFLMENTIDSKKELLTLETPKMDSARTHENILQIHENPATPSK
jgi:hypothetical protein